MGDGGMESLRLADDHTGTAQITQPAHTIAETDGSACAPHDEYPRASAEEDHSEGQGKKKRKPKKKAKKLLMLPSVLAAQDQLAWTLEQTARLGRHAIAKQAIAPGQLVLREQAVATVVRSQFAASICHTCFRDLPTGESAVQIGRTVLRGALQYKKFCSPECAVADSHDALTAHVHGRVKALAAAAQVEPELLRLLLELDSRRIPAPPAMHIRADRSHGWVLEASAKASIDSNGNHSASNGHHPDRGLLEAHGSSPGKQGKPAAAVDGESPSECEDGSSDKAGRPQKENQQRKQQPEASSNGASSPGAPKGSGGRSSQQQQGGADQMQGSEGGPKVLQCTLDEAFMLLSYPEEDSPEWRAVLTEASKSLQKAIRDSKTFEPGTIEQYLALAAVTDANAHGAGAANSSNTDRGLGLYPALSMLNHSCRPNCMSAGRGPIMEIRAIREISAGEQLTVCYVNMTEPRKIRAAELRATKHFSCACERCSEPLAASPDMMLEAVRCRSGKCDGFLLEQRPDSFTDGDTWTCTECSRCVPSLLPPGTSGAASKYPGALTEHFKHAWNQAVSLTQHKGHVAARPVFERLLAQAQEALHPTHVAIIDCLMPLVNCARAAGDVPEAARLLQQLLPALEAVCGRHTVEIGNLYALLGRLHLDRASSLPPAFQSRCKKQAKEAWSHALAAHTICLGESHEMCRDLRTRLRGLR